MRHWLRLVIRNWLAKPSRTLVAVAAVALGTGTVVWVTCAYESVRKNVLNQVVRVWLGDTHLTIESPVGHWGRFDARLVQDVAALDDVANLSGQLQRRMRALNPKAKDDPDQSLLVEVDVIGIDAPTHYQFQHYSPLWEANGPDGRLIRPGEGGVAMMERETAVQFGLRLGDKIELVHAGMDEPREFVIVGLFLKQRVAEFQRPQVIVPLSDLQSMTDDGGYISMIQVIIKNPTHDRIKKVAGEARELIHEKKLGLLVNTPLGHMQRLERFERIIRIVVLLISCVGLLTAAFLILATMSMGMVERMTGMGILRCVGATRGQLLSATFLETLPVGIVGAAAGIPIGVGLAELTTWWAPQYVAAVSLTPWGVGLGVGGGLVICLLGALLPAITAVRISPIEAVGSASRKSRLRTYILVAVAGLIMIGLHTILLSQTPVDALLHPLAAFSGVVLLWGGYGLLAPLLVLTVGKALTRLAAALWRIKPQLLNDQIARAAWRGGGICSVLMVGISFIVIFVVFSESVIASVDFVGKLAEGFVWSRETLPRSTFAAAQSLPGIRQSTLVNDIPCRIGNQEDSLFERLFKPKSTFVAGEVGPFLAMAEVDFLEGSLEDARAKLLAGGYVMVPIEAARSFQLKMGDKIDVHVQNRSATFEVAAIVQSSALSMASSFFGANTYLTFAASASVLGTLDDAKRCFGIDDASLILMNFNLPELPTPPVFEQPSPPDNIDAQLLVDMVPLLRDAIPARDAWWAQLMAGIKPWQSGRNHAAKRGLPEELIQLVHAMKLIARQWDKLTPKVRWDLFRERVIFQQIIAQIDRSDAIVGSIRLMKEAMDRDIRRATQLITAVPVVALLVAALGVGNLMMANVSSRYREIAILRAIGATRWQIVRMVMAESMVLGILGSLIGVTLGLHAAVNINGLTGRLFDLHPDWAVRWDYLAAAAGFTAAVCFAAGILPARHAARNNIISAMQVG